MNATVIDLPFHAIFIFIDHWVASRRIERKRPAPGDEKEPDGKKSFPLLYLKI